MMNLKTTLLAGMLIVCGIGGGCFTPLFAQQQASIYGEKAQADVKMKYVYSYEEAIKRAKAEKKLIFFNCFADWAVPCHLMNQQVFSDQEFADYMDKHFVNLFVDVTTEAGKPLAKRYDIRRFAQYLVLDASGEVVMKMLGGKKLPDFRNDVALALSPKTSLKGTTEAIKAGDKSRKTLLNYLYALSLAGERTKFNETAQLYLEQIAHVKKENWFIISAVAADKTSPYFDYLLKHRKDFEKNIGHNVVTNHIERVYANDLIGFATGNTPYSAEKMLELFTELSAADVPENSYLRTLYEIGKLRGANNISALLDYLDANGKSLGNMLGLIQTSLQFDQPDKNDTKRLIDYFRNLERTNTGTLQERFKNMADALEANGGIEFYEKIPFQDALDKARQEGKLLFIDCYTSWCAPCKKMAREVFVRNDVGKFFNANFVNVKMDMEKGEGIDVAKRYKIQSYPTMMIIRPNGEVAEQIIGFRQPKELLEIVRKWEKGKYDAK